MEEAEVIADTGNIRVRVMILKPLETADWHYHTQVTDHIFCLTGIIMARTQNPNKETHLAPGERCTVEAGTIHQLENLEDSDASYLLIQGIGSYDFNVVA